MKYYVVDAFEKNETHRSKLELSLTTCRAFYKML